MCLFIMCFFCAVDAPLPTPATTADPKLPSSKYFGITPTRAQTSLLHRKEESMRSFHILIPRVYTYKTVLD